MRKIELSPIVLTLGAVTIAAAGFFGGVRYGGFLPASLTGSDGQINFNSLNSVYGLMQRNFDGHIDPSKALEGAKAGLVAAGADPYTVYLDAKNAKQLENDLQGKLSGIGAEIGIKRNVLTVVAPIEGTPASRAGLRAGDLIARINGEDTTGMSVDTAVSKIRGKAGTKVTLKLVRTSAPDPFDVTITRADIRVPSVKWSMKTGNVGYINITRFGPDTTGLVDQAATELKRQGAKKLILDLRNNPGGYLDASVSISSQFLDPGKLVVEEKIGKKTKDKLVSRSGGRLRDIPTVVLINNGSASASEIVSGALRDHKAARLVGEKSFGKGSVQEIKNLPDGAQLKVTVAHWYTPAGININKEGIKPDIEVKMNSEDYNANRDPQLDKALELLK